MKIKKFTLWVILFVMVLMLTGCTQADMVSSNISKEADAFNVVREITVINCIQSDVLFQMTGRASIELDEAENQLEVVVAIGDGKYKKHFIGLSDNVTYVVEDISGAEVDNYNYTLYYNPKMWIPVNIESVK